MSIGSLIPHLIDLFPDEITYEPPAAIDGEGTITPGPAVTIPCKCTRGHRLTRGRDGREQVSTVQAELAGVFGVVADGIFTLPARFDPQQPKAISVTSEADEGGAHHEVVMF